MAKINEVKIDTDIVTWLDEPTVIDGVKWLIGTGNPNGNVLLVMDKPTEDDVRQGQCLSGQNGKLLRSLAFEHNIDLKNVYYTYAVKFKPKKKEATAKDIKLCNPFLKEEIRRIKPKLVVCFGKIAFEAVMNKKCAISDYRGSVLPYDDPGLPNTQVFPTFSPNYVLHNPGAMSECRRDWRILSELIKTDKIEHATTEMFVINKLEDLKAVIDSLLQKGTIILSLDCEWHGVTWMRPESYIRTVQFTDTIGVGIVVEFYDEHKNVMFDDIDGAWKLLKTFLTHPKVKLIGQNIISDGEWLMTYGIDIRDNVIYDTMLAEHTLNLQGPFGLEALTAKYTNLGRYELDLVKWRTENNDDNDFDPGYGRVPRSILLPYAACDVDAPLRIKQVQEQELTKFKEARGIYPSLWTIVMYTQKILYEVEMTGMSIDKQRLADLTKIYNSKLVDMETGLKTIASGLGVADFNFKSPQQVVNLLFNVLKIPPVKTTDGKPWEYVLDQNDEVAEDINPSTDKTTLEILQDAHPFVKLMRDARKIDHACKTWLRNDYDPAKYNEITKGGGLISKIWSDGKVHAHFSQLKETGRFSSSKPNMQNYPKKAEGDISRIFAGLNPSEKDKVKIPPLIKTVFVPDDGYVFMEADLVQAELFILAYLSKDKNMIKALTTPGMDLHDLTACQSFHIKTFYPDMTPVVEQDLFDIAKRDIKEFKKIQKTLLYVDTRGKVMTRDAFKGGIRVSAKNINFGIPYGRSAQPIAIQVKSETNTDKTIQELTTEIQLSIDAWKNELYPQAWSYMMECNRAVVDPGYIINPWGRVRPFPYTTDQKLISKMGREAQNFPVQSTVADTVMLAMYLITKYRKQYNLNCKICNQIHDSLLLMVPKNEIIKTEEMIQRTIGDIIIPIINNPLKLSVEIDVMSRWGVKIKNS